MSDRQAKAERVEHVNALIKIISDHGRRFFHHRDNGSGRERVAHFFLDTRGHVRYVDEYSGKIIYPYPMKWGNRWRGFTHGGTLRSLAEAMADYIRFGNQLSRHCIGPQMSYGDMWGYGDPAILAVRAAAFDLPIFAPLTKAAA